MYVFIDVLVEKNRDIVSAGAFVFFVSVSMSDLLWFAEFLEGFYHQKGIIFVKQLILLLSGVELFDNGEVLFNLKKLCITTEQSFLTAEWSLLTIEQSL